MSLLRRCLLINGCHSHDCDALDRCIHMPDEAPRSPAQPDAVELLRELHAMWPDIRQLQDGFMENSPGENWSEWDQRVRQWCIEFGPRIDAFLRGGSGG